MGGKPVGAEPRCRLSNKFGKQDKESGGKSRGLQYKQRSTRHEGKAAACLFYFSNEYHSTYNKRNYRETFYNLLTNIPTYFVETDSWRNTCTVRFLCYSLPASPTECTDPPVHRGRPLIHPCQRRDLHLRPYSTLRSLCFDLLPLLHPAVPLCYY